MTTLWVIGTVIVAALITLGGSLAYLIAHERSSNTAQVEDEDNADVTTDNTEVAVVHGGVVRPEELEGHGHLYFVPIGRQAIPVADLAEYYHNRFKIEITVLPEVKLESSSCIAARNQCVAEEMMRSMKRAYPKVARDPDSVMIALTDEDIFPRSLGWRFTYSFHAGYLSGIVSTRRMDPAFWGDAPDDAVRLANTKQMLTKYIGFMYFRVPYSHDPTSIMHHPLTPNGGPDDIYESDLHSEDSANGFWGEEQPCLFFTYSYDTGEIVPAKPVVADSGWMVPVGSPREETFQTQLSRGSFTQRSLDLQLDSMPKIELRRSYISDYPQPMSLGTGTNHNYNTWLYSDGESKLSFIDIIHEDGARDHLDRASRGRGFSTNVAFQSNDDANLIYGSRMTWDSNHFKLSFRDGSWSTYLPCTDGRCYWIGHQDATGNALHFDRDAALNLNRLSSGDNQGIEFQYDTQRRVTNAIATNGAHVSYQYGATGCLEKVVRSDGVVTTYAYDSGHHMTSMSVARRSGESPSIVLVNEYDSSGRVTRQTLPNGKSYIIHYGATKDDHVAEVSVTEPSGRLLNIAIARNEFTVRTNTVRFPEAQQSNSPPNRSRHASYRTPSE